MNMRAHQAYATTQRETAVAAARPVELVVMVYERVLEHLRVAQLQMADGEDPVEAVVKSIELITSGLQACLDFEQGAEVAANLDSIYEWACRELLRGRLRRDPSILQGVIDTMTPLAEAWRQLAEREDLGATVDPGTSRAVALP